MVQVRHRGWRDRARAFLFGEYPGAPVDYLMAIAIVLAMILVVVLALVPAVPA